LLGDLRKELMQEKQAKDTKLIESRTQLVDETETRIKHVRDLAATIEETLMCEIRNLNEALRKKDEELAYVLAADKKFMD
jgi:hypothetical protein